MRIADIVIGLITVILSALVLMYPELAVLPMIFVLSITLLVIGVARIFSRVFTEYLSDGTRVTNVVVGVSATVLGAIALGYPDLTTQVLIYILSLALLLTGIARIVIGGGSPRLFPDGFESRSLV
ncbi:MAG: DUF308 domain-containing protein [Candidatus Bathyarchaeota archaeon]|nr:MAG: DUF308 domain-containing protein [Candidatus Bathyarchaeota archaeon]